MILETRCSDRRFGRFGNVGRIRNLSSKHERERSIDNTKKDDEFIFPFADGTAKLSGRDFEFLEPTLRREQTARSKDLSGELQGESGESQPAVQTSGRSKGDFTTMNVEFKLSVPKEERFPIPLTYIDVTGSTHIDLDVLQEKRIDDYWMVESKRNLSDSWTGVTKFTLLKDKPPQGYTWSAERLTKNATDYQAKSCMATLLDENW